MLTKLIYLVILTALGAIGYVAYLASEEQSADGTISSTSEGIIEFTQEDVQVLLEKLSAVNARPGNVEIDPSQYPKIVGTYSENELVLIQKYYCTDTCPEAGFVSLEFEGITSEDECDEVGGLSKFDGVTEEYLYCEPGVSI